MNVDIINFAIKAHDGQKRKGNFDEPYVCHPIRVAGMVHLFGFDYFCAAILHDVLEDTKYTSDDIRNLLSKTVINTEQIIATIEALTIREGELKIDAIARLELSSQMAIIIKMADMIDNYKNATPERKEKHKERAALLASIAKKHLRLYFLEDQLLQELSNIFQL